MTHAGNPARPDLYPAMAAIHQTGRAVVEQGTQITQGVVPTIITWPLTAGLVGFIID